MTKNKINEKPHYLTNFLKSGQRLGSPLSTFFSIVHQTEMCEATKLAQIVEKTKHK